MKHQHRPFAVALFVALALAAILPSLSPAARTSSLQAAPALSRSTVSSVTTKNQVPRVAVSPAEVHVTWKSGPGTSAKTAYSEAPEGGGAWAPQVAVGGNSSGSYHTSSVAVSPVDRSVHMVWADDSQGGTGYIFYSRQQSNGAWTSPVRISSIGSFGHYPHVTVDSRGWIWAVWAVENPTGNSNIYYRFSSNNGASWQPGSEGLLSNNNAKRPWIAADRHGGIHAVWWANDGFIHYGYSTGGGFSVQPVITSGFNADPTVTTDGNTVWVAWRRQSGFAMFDVFVASKPIGGGSWAPQKLYAGSNINYSIPIYADNAGVLHVAWFDPSSGAGDIYYASKQPGGGWSSQAINVSSDGVMQVNPDVVGYSDGHGTRGHVVFESWYGGEGDTRVEHVRVGAGPVLPPTPTATATPSPSPSPTPIPEPRATPLIEGGARFTNKGTLSVALTNISGNPTHVRYRWGAPPTNANPWTAIPSSQTISVAAPAVSATGCELRTLYTQVMNSNFNVYQRTAANDAIRFDKAVQARVHIFNPYAPYNQAQGMESSPYPTAGDQDYIRSALFAYRVEPEPGGCSGVASYSAPDTKDSTHSGSETDTIIVTLNTKGWRTEGNGYAERELIVSVRVTDNLGNTSTTSRKLYYDDDAPQVSNVTQANLLQLNGDGTRSSLKLDFSNAHVSDDSYNLRRASYPNEQYWGVWLLVSTQNLGAAPSISTFANKGAAVVDLAPGQSDISISLISDSASDPGTAPGPRYIYLRFLDGAGNASDAVLATQAPLNAGYQRPLMRMPMIRR